MDYRNAFRMESSLVLNNCKMTGIITHPTFMQTLWGGTPLLLPSTDGWVFRFRMTYRFLMVSLL